MIVTSEPGSNSSLQAVLDQRRVGAFQVFVVFICAMLMLVEGADLAVIGLFAPIISKEWGPETGLFGPVSLRGSDRRALLHDASLES